MNNDHLFYEIAQASLNRAGEEVCGDQVKISRLPNKTILGLKLSYLPKVSLPWPGRWSI
jgi:hypothetical protein